MIVVGGDQARLQTRLEMGEATLPHLSTASRKHTQCALLPNLAASVLAESATPNDGMVNDQHNNGPDDGDDHAVDVEPSDRCCAYEREQKPADYCSNNAEHDVQDNTLATFVDDLTFR